MADNETDPPDTWEARLAYAEQLHAHVCRLSGCEGRDWHERRTGTSFMAVVTNPRAGSAYGVPPELAEYLPPDFAAPVANAPAGASEPEQRTVGVHPKTRAAACAALVAAVAVELAQRLVALPPELAQAISGPKAGVVLAVAQGVLVFAAAYQAGVGRVTTS